MAWSIFQEGGGNSVAVSWAQQLEADLGIPQSQSITQFLFDWEKSEGSGGAFNPLNQGPVPGHPELTTTGSQYGGGAADYASWQAGPQGSVDYLYMPNYTSVLSALKAGDANGARAALIASPWAESHYGNGANFSADPLPGSAQLLSSPIPNPFGVSPSILGAGALNLIPGASSAANSITGDIGTSIANGVKSVLSPLKVPFENMAVRVGLVIFGAFAVLVGVATLMRDGTTVSGNAKDAATLSSNFGKTNSNRNSNPTSTTQESPTQTKPGYYEKAPYEQAIEKAKVAGPASTIGSATRSAGKDVESTTEAAAAG